MRAGDAIGKRADQADFGKSAENIKHSVEPAFCDDGVVIEQENVCAASEREAALLRAWVAREAWFKAAGAGAPWDFRRLDCEPCDAADANVRVWESRTLRVALCARDGGALAAASCGAWPRASDVRSSTWRVRVLANA